MSDSGNNENDIAIVGISLRVPGAQTPSAFWENLRDGVESIQRLDEETLLAAGESAETLRQPNYINASGSLENMKMFDGEDSQEDIERHALEWIAENRELVDRWLVRARIAGS